MNSFLSMSYNLSKIQSIISSKSDLEWELFSNKLCSNNDNVNLVYDYTNIEDNYENITFLLKKLYYNFKSQIQSQNIGNSELIITILETVIYDKNCLKLISNSFCINFLLLVYIDFMRFERSLKREINTKKLRKLITLTPKKITYTQELLKNEEFRKEIDSIVPSDDTNQKFSENIGMNIQNSVLEESGINQNSLPYNWKQNEM